MRKDDEEILNILIDHFFQSNLKALDLKGPLKSLYTIQLDEEQKNSQTLVNKIL